MFELESLRGASRAQLHCPGGGPGLIYSWSQRRSGGSGEPTPKQLQAALNEVLSESKVVDAAWGEGAPGAVLYAGLKDDGTRRDGYAEYLCLVLADHGLRGGMVYVVDYRNFSRGARQRLGHAQCVK